VQKEAFILHLFYFILVVRTALSFTMYDEYANHGI